MNQQEIGKKIRKLREEKNFSLDELSQKAGLSSDHIGRVERGDATNMRLGTLFQIAKALGSKVRIHFDVDCSNRV